MWFWILPLFLVWYMVFNATFNNIWVISWQSVLLMEETEYPKKTTDLSQVNDKFFCGGVMIPFTLFGSWGIHFQRAHSSIFFRTLTYYFYYNRQFTMWIMRMSLTSFVSLLYIMTMTHLEVWSVSMTTWQEDI